MVGQFLSVMNMSVTHSVHYIFLQCGWAISVRNEHVCDTLSALYFAAVQLSEVIVTRRETALSSDVMCDASGAAPACLKDGMFFSLTPARSAWPHL